MASFSSSVIASTSFCARHAGSRPCALHGPFTGAAATAARDLAGAAGATTIEPVTATAVTASDQRRPLVVGPVPRRRRINGAIRPLLLCVDAEPVQSGGAQDAQKLPLGNSLCNRKMPAGNIPSMHGNGEGHVMQTKTRGPYA